MCAFSSACASAGEPNESSALERAPLATFRNYNEMTRVVRELVDGSNGAATLEKIATTAGQRTVWSIRLALPSERPAEARLGILLIGGIDAESPASSDLALEMAGALLQTARQQPDSDAAALLKTRTLYVVPRVNPDGIEAFFEPVQRCDRVNGRAVDNDRDDAANEDGPNDLNKDGAITVMRVKDLNGEWMIDPSDARLMKKPDRTKGEKGIYRLMQEGIDDDNDGAINEDGPGGVDDDRNWPHWFEPGNPETGLFPLSEPETRGLADFVLAHRTIAAAIVLGRNDNVVNVQKGNTKGPSGQDFKELHPDDVKLYEAISEKYKEISGIKTAPAGKVEGALYSWLYSQQGIPTFAINPWWPLDSLPAASQPASAPAAAPDAPQATPEKPPSPEPTAGGPPPGGPPREGGRPRRGGRGGRGGGGPPGGLPGGGGGDAPAGAGSGEMLAAGVEVSDTLKKWLRYYGDKEPAAFVAWSPFQHPTLGPVEIGGLKPNATIVPPLDDFNKLIDPQAAFLKHVATLLPNPQFAKAKVKELGGSLWQVEVRMRNASFLPTHLAISRQVGNPGFSLKPQVAPDRILGGRQQVGFDNLAGGGEVASSTWLIRGNKGDKVQFRAFNRVYGEFKTEIELKATTPGEENE